MYFKAFSLEKAEKMTPVACLLPLFGLLFDAFLFH